MGYCEKHGQYSVFCSGCDLDTIAENELSGYALDHVDDECHLEQDIATHRVSGYMAGKAYNDICRMLGGRWPDARLEQEAPEAHKFFMALFDA